ncbi:hypothetical protein F2Q68_00007915 [Brassica cretica]|uniref:Uncharacterized protein n=1 Tax=Brassica cretica TaxID=69181 RepID=A0A8S9KNM8_BRACR|nr:hypothetical protein F2Q68_00007915 [Brassica cretica]
MAEIQNFKSNVKAHHELKWALEANLLNGAVLINELRITRYIIVFSREFVTFCYNRDELRAETIIEREILILAKIATDNYRERESYLGEDRDGDGEVPAVIGTAEESDYRELFQSVKAHHKLKWDLEANLQNGAVLINEIRITRYIIVFSREFVTFCYNRDELRAERIIERESLILAKIATETVKFQP